MVSVKFNGFQSFVPISISQTSRFSADSIGSIGQTNKGHSIKNFMNMFVAVIFTSSKSKLLLKCFGALGYFAYGVHKLCGNRLSALRREHWIIYASEGFYYYHLCAGSVGLFSSSNNVAGPNGFNVKGYRRLYLKCRCWNADVECSPFSVRLRGNFLREVTY